MAAQTSLGHGEDDTGRLIHEISCAGPNTVFLGSGVVWSVTKVTINNWFCPQAGGTNAKRPARQSRGREQP